MRIFTLEEYLQDKIPKLEDILSALNKFEEESIVPFLDAIYSAFSYGSIKRGDFNIASDIDYFIIINYNWIKDKIKEGTENALKNNVQIQARILKKELAEKGVHTINPNFRQHLELSAKKYGFHGKNPFSILKNNGDFYESIRITLGIYSGILNNSYVNYFDYQREYYNFLKDILEKPFHTIRVMIQSKLGTLAKDESGDFIDTKKELFEAYKEFYKNQKLNDKINLLLNVSKEYLDILDNKNKNELNYKNILKKIENCYPTAISFIEENALLINQPI